MKQKDMSPRYQQLLECFTYLPQRMLSLHELDNITEFVLHALCEEECLNFSKAAYFVDNPDFDCFKGIAGFDKSNEFDSNTCKWQNPECFSNHMSNCKYNQKVRGINKPSPKKGNKAKQQIAQDLSDELLISDPLVYVWSVKHNNHGVLVFERLDNEPLDDDKVLQGLCLLGFCPIF